MSGCLRRGSDFDVTPRAVEDMLTLLISNCNTFSGMRNRPYAYDVTEGRPAALGVKRGTATCAIAKHAARGPTPACHIAGLARARALTERLSANALCQHNTCAQLDPQHGVVAMET